ncbi:YsnF/AvaK domain-containing protein [Nodosilinea sp. E11]|uniref:YsnF/AvaK domain-containing protein n=1 Tax=Nodosilinea sp. E11 TaxID=3037479 RepID=UPI002934F8C5|nr:YsnF/AvaK domain-containing protein [Nodosilinea sp. E11]WOD39135.1 YsnF/AvaK domain-containing protein [Nodosilinea sp. E11]
MSQPSLIDASVFDCSGYLIGRVARVEPLESGNFTLVVTPLGSNGSGNEIKIDNSHIHGLDSEQRVIHIDLEHQQFLPDLGTGIQLLEERLVVNRKRVKVGEVSIRRVIETEIIEVPIHREKLVIEKIGGGEPPIEVNLGGTRLEGYEVATQLGHSIDDQKPSVSGNFGTIPEAIEFIRATGQRSDQNTVQNCEKVRVAILLDSKTGLKGTVYDFESLETAADKLARLDKVLLNQCSNVRLELFLKDYAMLPAYQDWFAQYASPQAQH